MNKEMIIQELKERGYDVEEKGIIKNGLILNAIIFKNDYNIAPTFYIDDVIKNANCKKLTLDEVCDDIINLYEKHKIEKNFDVDGFLTKEYVYENVKIAIQKNSVEDYLVKAKTEFEELESYLYIGGNDDVIGGNYSIKISRALLEKLKLDEVELWEVAKTNTFKDTCISSLGSILGIDENVMPGMYIISNKQNYKGASAILDKESINKFAEEINVSNFVILPSSIHECILIPCEPDTDLNTYTQMVKEVNATNVDPTEQLLNKAILYNVETENVEV